MIVGIGNDVVDMRRLQRVWRDYPERLLARILTEDEQRELAKSANKLSYLAGRWAAKEALFKALRPQSAIVTWQRVAVLRDEDGAPRFSFSSGVEKYLKQRGIVACHVSISHDGDYVFAMVTAERHG